MPDNTAENTEPTTDAEQPQDATQETPDTDREEQEQPRDKGGAEAAKYRTRLRQAEAERDAVLGQLDAAREQILQNHISGRLGFPGEHGYERGVTLQHPEDIFTVGGLDKTKVWKTDGTLDLDAIGAAAKVIADTRPGLTHRVIVPSQGDIPDTSRLHKPFSEAFTPKEY